MTIKAVAYARYSSDHQRSESIDAQLRAINKYADEHDISIVNTYIDEAKSATTDNRPQFLKMFEDINNINIDLVLVHKLDRFSRDKYDSAIYKKKLKEHNIKLFSITEKLGNTPEDIILESLLEGMNQYYVANLARETMKGLIENAHKAMHNGGLPPLGYDVDSNTKKYIINHNEAEAVKLIFRLYIKGYGYIKIIDELNKRGYKTKTNRPFRKNSIHSILDNEKYNGTYIYNRTVQKINGKRNNRINKQDDQIIIIKNGIPAIISKNTWNKARQRREFNKHTTNHKVNNYLLTGLIYCGNCGNKMIGNTRTAGRNKSTYVTYECYNKRQTKQCNMKAVNKEYIEKSIELEIEKIINTPNFLKELYDAIDNFNKSKIREIKKEIKSLEHNLSKINFEIDNLILAIKNGLYNSKLTDELNELENNKHELINCIENHKSKLREIQNEITENKKTDLIADFYINSELPSILKVPKVKNNLAETRLFNNILDENRNILINEFITKIIIYENSFELHFKKPEILDNILNIIPTNILIRASQNV